MLKEGVESFSNRTEDLEGLSIDIIEKMKETLKFDYRIMLVRDFGVKDRLTGKWNGIVREIIDEVFPIINLLYN